MIWQEISIDRIVSDQRIVAATSELFGISPATVMVYGNYSELPAALGDEIQVLCERIVSGGDFPLRLGIIPRSPALEKFAQSNEDTALIEQLCRLLDVSCLMSDDTLNSYRWLLIRPGLAPRAVHVDPDRLDDRDELVIRTEESTIAAS